MGTEKRERQKVGKQTRAAAEFAAARRAKTRRTAVRVTIGVIAILAVLFGYSALQGDDDSDTSSDETTTPGPECPAPSGGAEPAPDGAVADRAAPDPEPPPADTPADALECTMLIEGEGDAAATGDAVQVNYVGKTPDGQVFDSSYEEGREPIDVTLGQGSVIPGWDEGLVGAKVGERRRLVIGSENAYGAEGRPDGGIPANSPLAFEVDVVEITPGTPAGGSGG